jgi:alpha-1,2-mannosyltransferase
VAIWGAVLAALWLRWHGSGTWNFVDLEDFFYGGVSVRDGVDLYAPRPGVLAFNYPPFAGVAFVALAVMGLPVAKVAFTATTLAAYVVSLAAVRRAIPVSAEVVVLVGLAGLALEPVVRVLVLGQVGVILMALVLADLFLVPPRYRGCLVGVAAGIKLTPALFLVYFLLRHDWRSCGRCVATFGATVAVGWMFAPNSSTRYWLGGFDKLDRFGVLATTPINQSVKSFASRIGAGSGIGLWVCVLLVLALAAAAAWWLSRSRDWPMVALVLAAAMLLLSPISWTHHWVWVVPALLILASRRARVTLVIVAATFYVAPMWLVPQVGPLSFPQLVMAYAYLVAAVAFIAGATGWRALVGRVAQRRGGTAR